jgi:hypothetical protein
LLLALTHSLPRVGWSSGDWAEVPRGTLGFFEPLLELGGSHMLGVKVDLSLSVTRIETLSIVVWDSGSFDGQDHVLLVVVSSCQFTPEGDSNLEVALINNGYVSPVFLRAWWLNVHLHNGSNLSDDSDGVHSPGLLAVVNLIDSHEAVAHLHDTVVVLALLDVSILVHNHAVVILDAWVLLVGHLYDPIGEQIHFVLLKEVVVLISLFLEEGCLYLSTSVVDEVNVQQTAWSFCVFPLFLGMLLCDPSLDLPVEEESVEGFDGSVLRCWVHVEHSLGFLLDLQGSLFPLLFFKIPYFLLLFILVSLLSTL